MSRSSSLLLHSHLIPCSPLSSPSVLLPPLSTPAVFSLSLGSCLHDLPSLLSGPFIASLRTVIRAPFPLSLGLSFFFLLMASPPLSSCLPPSLFLQLQSASLLSCPRYLTLSVVYFVQHSVPQSPVSVPPSPVPPLLIFFHVLFSTFALPLSLPYPSLFLHTQVRCVPTSYQAAFI